jgi:hypothetical protein
MHDGVLEAARAIRPYLDELLGDDAAPFDDQVAALLAAAHTGADVTGPLQILLGSREATVEWVEEVLDDPQCRPPDFQPTDTRSYESPTGLVGLVIAGKYACPYGDFVWYRPAVDVPVLPCRTHGPVLARVAG